MIYIQKIGNEVEFACDDRRDIGLLKRCKIRRTRELVRNNRKFGEFREWCVPENPSMVLTIFTKDSGRQVYWHDSMAPYLPREAMPDMKRLPGTRYWHYEPRLGRDEGKEPRS